MKYSFFPRKTEGSDQIAKQRLKMMAEATPLLDSPETARRMKKEISDIISRYYEIGSENYEIKVILKQNKKRA